ncbi:MAG: hypothetical protein M3261_02920 [Thermoproteota archaeon]|nr:hypothetical protein [Thermoproteota archaeon]
MIAITPDPNAVQNHLGKSPIYGIVVVSPDMMKQMRMMIGHGDMKGQMNMTGMTDMAH